MSPAKVCAMKRAIPEDSLHALPYPPHIPDAEYIALCTHVYHDQHSRNYGERVYVYFQIFEGEHQGKTLRMFLRPSRYPTSNFYRAWAIAHGGPPMSRNTKMSARAFRGKLFRVLTTTVKPWQMIPGLDGKMRRGPQLPEPFWYSRVACLLSLEATNDAIFLTEDPHNSFSHIAVDEGIVGSVELGARNLRAKGVVAVGDRKLANDTQPAGGVSEIAPSALSPQFTEMGGRGDGTIGKAHGRAPCGLSKGKGGQL